MFDLQKPLRLEGVQSFFITSGLFLLTFLIWGWNVDTYQNLIDFAYSGEFTRFMPVKGSPFPEYLAGMSAILPYLNQHYPARWLAFLLQGILFVSLWVIYYFVLKEMKPVGRFQTVCVVMLLSGFLMESVALYHMVRVAMFAGIAGLAFVFTTGFNSSKFLTRNTIPFLLLFGIGCWIRFNVLLFVIAFTVLVFIVHRKNLKCLFPYLAVFVFFSLYNSTFLNPERLNQLHYYFAYDAEFKLLYAGEYSHDVTLHGKLDSVKYEALQSEFFSDEKNLGRDFYERIHIFKNFRRISANAVTYATSYFKDAMRQNIYYLIADLILLFFYLLGSSSHIKHFRRKTLFLFIAFYMMIFAICFLKMENRFLVPMQIFFLLTMLMVHRPGLFFNAQQKKYLLVLLLYCLPATGYYTYAKIKEEWRAHEAYKFAFDAMAANYGRYTFVQQDIISYREKPYQTFTYANTFKKFYLYNNRTFAVSPCYQPFIEKECNCNAGDFAPFYDYLFNQCRPVVFLDRPARIIMLEKYLKEVHGRSYHFNALAMDSATDVNLRKISEMSEPQGLFTFAEDSSVFKK